MRYLAGELEYRMLLYTILKIWALFSGTIDSGFLTLFKQKCYSMKLAY